MDFEVKAGKVANFRYRLLPVFSNFLKPDPQMDALITRIRAPYEAKLNETLAVTDGLLYRRGNFNGSWDQLVCDALMDVQGAEIAFSPGFRWGTSLLPVFSNFLKPDPQMDALITRIRAPYEAKLNETLAVTDGLLYRRGNFNGSWDQLVCDALMDVQGAEIAFSPGFRWGTSLLPGQAITRELMMDQLAITYPYATVTPMTGETIKTVLEDVADNLFNPDPYYQQGGDMVRVGGLEYTMTPGEKMGARITDMRLNGKPIEAGKSYKVAGWAPVAEEASKAGNKPVWDVVETWLKARPGQRVSARKVNTPKLVGVQGNPGMAA
jgi:sulfur-oxidizing protein SoxB